MAKYVGAIDQGTTSTRFILFDEAGEVVTLARREHAQICPRPGWVEHDATEIWRNTLAVIDEALAKASAARSDLAAIGVANQRETTVLWDKATGAPLCNAIVWMDTRTEALVARFASDGGTDRLRARTGLPLASYFSGLKLVWLFENLPGARARAQNGEVLFGTIDSWLIWNLTGGPRGGLHVTDATNASRTQLMNLATLDWDEDILRLFDIPRACLPAIRSSSEFYGAVGSVPLAGAIGDQQGALLGQACLKPGEAKNTYGTGCFVLMNTGETPKISTKGLLTTLAYKLGEFEPVYALEGSVAIAGALVQWLRDNLGIIDSSEAVEPLARSVADNGDVYFVPAFSGLYAPRWRARRARPDRRSHALFQQRTHRQSRAGGGGLPDPRGSRRDGRGRSGVGARGAARRRRHGGERTADAISGGYSRRSRRAPTLAWRRPRSAPHTPRGSPWVFGAAPRISPPIGGRAAVGIR